MDYAITEVHVGTPDGPLLPVAEAKAQGYTQGKAFCPGCKGKVSLHHTEKVEAHGEHFRGANAKNLCPLYQK